MIIKFPGKKKTKKRRILRGFCKDNVLQLEQPLPDVAYFCPECGQQVFTEEGKRRVIRAYELLDQIKKKKEKEA